MGHVSAASKRVLILGGGFGGLTTAQSLAAVSVKITLIDRTNHHVFQPLLYQVAMAGLSPAEIAMPIRSILRRRAEVTVRLDEANAIDLKRKQVL
jgi:NADH dehydrogenase